MKKSGNTLLFTRKDAGKIMRLHRRGASVNIKITYTEKVFGVQIFAEDEPEAGGILALSSDKKTLLRVNRYKKKITRTRGVSEVEFTTDYRNGLVIRLKNKHSEVRLRIIYSTNDNVFKITSLKDTELKVHTSRRDRGVVTKYVAIWSKI